MYIYLAPHSEVFKPGQFDEFAPSEWNEMEKLPNEAISLIEWAKDNDCVFTPYNFMLCFNLQDKETYHGDYVMFIPDPKFNIKPSETCKN